MPGPGLDILGAEEIQEILEVLNSRELSRYRFDDVDHGAKPSKVYQFERNFESLTGAGHALGMNSCTSALLCGLWAAGIGEGDEVLVPGYMFVASVASIVYSGATPVLVEIDDSFCVDPEDISRKITPRTRALMVVHMLGAPAAMDELRALAQKHNLMLIEDCAQAGGCFYKQRAVGTFGIFGAFSLNVFKTFTAGDGGILLTNDEDLYKKAFAIHDHGAAPFRVGVTDSYRFFGLNFRMHELTGAVAGAQLRKLRENLARLRASKQKLATQIGEIPGARRRRLTDAEGECGTVLVYIFDHPEVAHRVASALGIVPLSRSGKHNYANIPQLSQPARFGSRAGHFNFGPGCLPRTDDLLNRSLALSVGVSDSYLGTGFGINVHSTEPEIERAAEKFRMTVEQIHETMPN